MITDTSKLPPIVQYYERHQDREYFIYRKGLIFSHYEKVRVDKIENELVLNITTEQNPDKILFNGKEVKLTPIK